MGDICVYHVTHLNGMEPVLCTTTFWGNVEVHSTRNLLRSQTTEFPRFWKQQIEYQNQQTHLYRARSKGKTVWTWANSVGSQVKVVGDRVLVFVVTMYNFDIDIVWHGKQQQQQQQQQPQPQPQP